jgi:L-lactate dehydrogenase
MNLHNLVDEVKGSAYKIIESKGATYYAIAEATRRICSSIVRNENSILPVSAYVNGLYGLDDVCLGLPSIIGNNGIKTILEIPLNKQEKEKLMESAVLIKNIISEIKL